MFKLGLAESAPPALAATDGGGDGTGVSATVVCAEPAPEPVAAAAADELDMAVAAFLALRFASCRCQLCAMWRCMLLVHSP